MSEPACEKPTVEETVELVEHYLKCALEHTKEMDKNESVWHPNAVPGVSVSLSNETMRLIGTAMRELERLKEDADEFMHRIGYLAGRLDVTGGTSDGLVKLCQEVRDELAFAADRYWKS